MPFVKIDLWKGREKGTKKKLIEAVQVVISEVEKENWGLGGAPADEKFPDKK